MFPTIIQGINITFTPVHARVKLREILGCILITSCFAHERIFISDFCPNPIPSHNPLKHETEKTIRTMKNGRAQI